ncbi:hypothetical protein PENANT_c007G05565 [Penicillium antarcticum]|uniref:Fatty acyl-CoA reductase n=1 Tax=Penicillium antarcticum TaxID=416450 RepID=A0A1V6QBG0_9EURO|nr:Male sterility NAD-binding [Penicillium antarcticum]KAJ5312527.1 Male sterility NAD-binding [Penicillium antarcticum]OQD86530.1 hypothetical protein PENANT_c007G05565 [Penicillium antarcticum]
MTKITTLDPEWYRGQVIFLTGATGNLGGCLLYKLALQLPTSKIFVLVRGSIREAIEKWEDSMPEQVDEILDTGKVNFLLGDVTQASLGLATADLELLQEEVTVVINSAADINLYLELSKTILVNCTGHLMLTALLDNFKQMQCLLHISTTHVNSFLPEGLIEEQIYPLHPNPKEELEKILATGTSADADQFSSPYSLAKHLAERLILDEEHAFPILIVRPSVLAPAIEEPYPLYGINRATPAHFYIHTILGNSNQGLSQLEHTLPAHPPCDETPVDLVARVCLAHLAQGTTGIVHAATDLYVSWTCGEMQDRFHRYIPSQLKEDARKVDFQQSSLLAPYFFQMILRFWRDWKVDCSRSRHLKQVKGPFGLDLGDHDPEAFLKRRIERQSKFAHDQLKRRSVAYKMS